MVNFFNYRETCEFNVVINNRHKCKINKIDNIILPCRESDCFMKKVDQETKVWSKIDIDKYLKEARGTV